MRSQAPDVTPKNNTQAKWRIITQADIDAEERASKPINLEPLEQLIEKYRYERENLIALINRLNADVKQHENRLHIADMTLCDLKKTIKEMKQ